MSADCFTPTQKRMLAILADGRSHTCRELHACLYDDQGSLSNIRAHLTAMRKLLRPKGQDVCCEILHRVVYYRLVRLV